MSVAQLSIQCFLSLYKYLLVSHCVQITGSLQAIQKFIVSVHLIHLLMLVFGQVPGSYEQLVTQEVLREFTKFIQLMQIKFTKSG